MDFDSILTGIQADQILEDVQTDVEMAWITIDWWTMVNRAVSIR